MKKYLIVILLLSLLLGCDSQSPGARFVSGLNVILDYNPNYTDRPARLDYWEASSRDIWSASFGYAIQVTKIDGLENVPVAGVRVDCYIEHSDPFDAGYDIWEQFASIGKKYGFVNAYPPQTANWNFEESHASAKTDASGWVAFYIGLGNSGSPGSERPWGWEWPGDSGTMISTVVKLRFVIRKWNGLLEEECHVYFLRPQGADFWTEEIGVYYVSYSSLNPAPDIWGMSMAGTEAPAESIMTLPSVTPRLENANSFSQLDKLIEKDSLKASADVGLLEEDWFRLAPNENGDWTWDVFDSLNVLPSPDPCIPNDANDIFSYSTPYSFFCLLEYEPWYETCCHTVILKSKTSEGELVSWMPIWMYLWEYEGLYQIYKTEFVVPIDTSIGEGRYIDPWGYNGVMIKVVEGGYLEVKIDDFYGDFNFDGVVDGKDFAMFARRWYWNMFEYQYMHYNLMYDADGDGQTDEYDLIVFVGNWLKERPK